MSLPQPHVGCTDEDRSQDTVNSSNKTLQRGIPSFKLTSDECARTKRFRNRVPSSGGRGEVGSSESGGSMSTMLLDCAYTPSDHAAGGPRRVPSFSLSGDVFRASASRDSSWGSGTGSNMFGFGSASADGEGEEEVQRLDDVNFNDLNFLTMEGVGPSDISTGTAPREPSGAGLDMKTIENAGTPVVEGGFDQYHIGGSDVCGGFGGNHLQQVAVPKEEVVVNEIVGRPGSVLGTLSTTSSGREDLGSDSMSRKDSGRGISEANMFDLEVESPIFSADMEEYLNRQLEVAEKSLDRSGEDERAFGQVTNDVNNGGDGDCKGGSGSVNSPCIGFVEVASASPTPSSTPSAFVKSESDLSLGGPDGFSTGTSCSPRIRSRGDTSKPKVVGRRTRYGRGSQQQQQQQGGQGGNEPTEISRNNEHESPAPRMGASKKMRIKGRAGTTTSATRAPKSRTGVAAARTASLPSSFVRRGTLKRQTSEDVAARLPLEVLERFYHVPLNIAATQLSVSLTMLKKLCRAYGVKRWPHRQVSSLDKTTSKLEEKIKSRKDSGKDAPSLVRKLTQARKRRSVIIKTASAGLDANVLNSIFTCRPGDIDEDLLLSSDDVAKVVENMKFSSPGDSKEYKSHSESDENNDDDEDDEREDGDDQDVGTNASAVKPPPTTAQKKVSGIRSVKSVPPCPPPEAPAAVKLAPVPPPAFEPGGHTKSVAMKNVDADVGKKVGDKPIEKVERSTPLSRKSTKVVAAAAAAAAAAEGKCRLGAMVIETPSAAPAGLAASTLQKKDASGGSTSSCVPEGSSINSAASGTTLPMMGADFMPGSSSTVFPFGSSPRNRAPMTGYSGVFGMGLHPHPLPVPGRGGDSVSNTGAESGGGSFGRTPPPGQPGTVGSPSRVPPTTRVPVWVGAGGKRAIGFGEWRGGTSTSQTSLTQQQRSPDAGSDSPTTSSTLDSFNMKLSLESPPRGQIHPSSSLPPPPQPPPPLPPNGHHPYLLHHQFPHPHQQHPYFSHLNWVGGRYTGPPQPPYGFPLELMSPINTRYSPPHHGTSSRGFHGFSQVDGGGREVKAEADAGNPPPPSTNRTAEVGGEAEGEAKGAAVAPEVTVTTSEDARPRRTGFMSYLLHQAPQSPPFGPCSSPPAPPPAPVAATDIDL